MKSISMATVLVLILGACGPKEPVDATLGMELSLSEGQPVATLILTLNNDACTDPEWVEFRLGSTGKITTPRSLSWADIVSLPGNSGLPADELEDGQTYSLVVPLEWDREYLEGTAPVDGRFPTKLYVYAYVCDETVEGEDIDISALSPWDSSWTIASTNLQDGSLLVTSRAEAADASEWTGCTVRLRSLALSEAVEVGIGREVDSSDGGTSFEVRIPLANYLREWVSDSSDNYAMSVDLVCDEHQVDVAHVDISSLYGIYDPVQELNRDLQRTFDSVQQSLDGP
ncbi:MAG: hypothetical protein KC561_05535 [Myxococcales bacterium]|nr:hypothetical protein [Myxococcales bacterium]